MEQNTDEWLEIRKSKIGASDAPIIMEESPYGTPYLLWEEKLGLYKKEFHAGLKYGQDLEPIARRLLEDELMCSLDPRVVFHPEHSWMMASLDALNIEAGIAAEIKNPNEETHELARSGVIPEKYRAQLQHQLSILNSLYGINQMYYFSHRQGDTVLLTVEMDHTYIKRMIEKEYDFWQKVMNKIPPEKTERDYIELKDVYVLTVADELVSITNELKNLRKREKELRQVLIEASNGRNSVCGPVKITKVIHKGSVDYESIPELENIDLDKYRKDQVEIWRVSC